MSDLMREEMKKAYEDVVGEPWDDAGLHKQAWCISWEKAWQASRETLAIELPKPDSDDGDSWDQCFKSGVSQCRDAIHAAGVKTK